MKNKFIAALIITLLIVIIILSSSVLILARAYTDQSNRIAASSHHLMVMGISDMSWMYKQFADAIKADNEEKKAIAGTAIGNIMRNLRYINHHLLRPRMRFPHVISQLWLVLGVEFAELEEPLSLEQRQFRAEAFRSAGRRMRTLIVDFQHKSDAASIKRYDRYFIEALSDLEALLPEYRRR